jgi:hypothetical protein
MTTTRMTTIGHSSPRRRALDAGARPPGRQDHRRRDALLAGLTPYPLVT